MRTRRSYRNQERLWKALGGKKQEIVKPEPLLTEQIKGMWWVGKTSRNRLLKEAKKGQR